LLLFLVAISLVPVLTLFAANRNRDERISKKIEEITDEWTGKFQAWFTALMQQK